MSGGAGATTYTIVRMDGHSHLDRQVRPEGQCPGCDRIWQLQQARLSTVQRIVRATRELDGMADRPKPGNQGHTWCPAIRDRGRETHTCTHDRGHRGKHWCPLHDHGWT